MEHTLVNFNFFGLTSTFHYYTIRREFLHQYTLQRHKHHDKYGRWSKGQKQKGNKIPNDLPFLWKTKSGHSVKILIDNDLGKVVQFSIIESPTTHYFYEHKNWWSNWLSVTYIIALEIYHVMVLIWIRYWPRSLLLLLLL